MAPYPDHRPSHCPKFPGGEAVPSPVPRDFGFPEIRVVSRRHEAARTAVPETPIHENRQAARGKRKIGATRQVKMPTPARQARAPQQARHFHFGALVAPRPYPRHDAGPSGTAGQQSFSLVHGISTAPDGPSCQGAPSRRAPADSDHACPAPPHRYPCGSIRHAQVTHFSPPSPHCRHRPGRPVRAGGAGRVHVGRHGRRRTGVAALISGA